MQQKHRGRCQRSIYQIELDYITLDKIRLDKYGLALLINTQILSHRSRRDMIIEITRVKPIDQDNIRPGESAKVKLITSNWIET